MKYFKLLLPLILLFFVSCTTDNNEDVTGTGSVFVLNEGAFLHGNASITSYDPYTGLAEQNYFSRNNGRPLGDVAQSAALIDDQLFVVVNNSHKIEVVDPATVEANHTINLDGELSPRYIERVGENKAYITSYSDSVAVLNLESLEVTGYINIGSRTEGIARVGQRVYVANTFNRDMTLDATTVSVIDSENDEVIQDIELRSGPSVVKVDSRDRVWVVCNGPSDENWAYNEGAVYVLNGSDGTIIETIELHAGSGDLVFYEDEGVAYIASGGLRVIDMDDFTISETPLINRSFYSLGFDETDGPRIYAGLTPSNYEQAGTALIYNVDGVEVDSFSTGIAPAYFHFTK